MVVYRLAGHSSGIKEKIQIQIGEKLEGNKEGMNELIKFLDTIMPKMTCPTHGRSKICSLI